MADRFILEVGVNRTLQRKKKRSIPDKRLKKDLTFKKRSVTDLFYDSVAPKLAKVRNGGEKKKS